MARTTLAVSLNDQFEPDGDIRRYLKAEFARIRAEHKQFKLSPGWPLGTTIDQLVSKSSGQFIYASNVVKFVDDIYDNPRERLDIVLKTHPINSVAICTTGRALYPDTFATAKHQAVARFIHTDYRLA